MQGAALLYHSSFATGPKAVYNIHYNGESSCVVPDIPQTPVYVQSPRLSWIRLAPSGRGSWRLIPEEKVHIRIFYLISAQCWKPQLDDVSFVLSQMIQSVLEIMNARSDDALLLLEVSNLPLATYCICACYRINKLAYSKPRMAMIGYSPDDKSETVSNQ